MEEVLTRTEKNKKRTEKSNKIIEIRKKIWNFAKFPLLVIIIGLSFIFGFKYSDVFRTQTKTTKLGFKDVGELVTQTCYVTELQDNKKDREFFKLFKIPLTESRQIFSYDVEVDSSVNFEKIEYETDDTNKVIIISLPHSRIYKTYLNEESLKVYLDNESLFSNIDMTESNEARIKMKNTAEADCKANGLLEKGDENAKKIIESMIKSNPKYKEYKVEYKYIEGEK